MKKTRTEYYVFDYKYDRDFEHLNIDLGYLFYLLDISEEDSYSAYFTVTQSPEENTLAATRHNYSALTFINEHGSLF